VKICILRSGSSGNCSIIEDQGIYLLLDAGGMSQRRIREVLSEIGITPEVIKGLLITHTHSDHLNYSALKVCEKNNIPVYIHTENIEIIKNAFGSSLYANLQVIPFEKDPFIINDVIQISPFEISHDAAKVTSGFSIKNQSGDFFTYAADLGYFPDTLIPNFINSKLIILEANHDPQLLWNNPGRPLVHKKRVAGNYGHLSNVQTADALIKIFNGSQRLPEKVVLCHLSKDHNSPELATATIKDVFDKNGVNLPIFVAKRNERTAFFNI
jgi:phosphoribosyl 1,2-cyclic phosphodiesterase